METSSFVSDYVLFFLVDNNTMQRCSRLVVEPLVKLHSHEDSSISVLTCAEKVRSEQPAPESKPLAWTLADAKGLG